MNKLEIREYLTKIYDLPVESVNTAIFLGKRKRILTQRKMEVYKRSDHKTAYVTFKEDLAPPVRSSN